MASKDLGSLYTNFTASTTGLKKGVDDASNLLDKFENKQKGTYRRMSKRAPTIGKVGSAAGIGNLFSGLLTGAGIAAMLKGAGKQLITKPTLPTVLGGAALLGGGYLASRAFGKGTEVSDRYADLAKRSKGIGLGVDEMRHLDYLGESSGVPSSALATLRVSMLEKTGKALKGDKAAVKAFKNLGIDPAVFAALSMADQFKAMQQVFRGKGAAQQVALAQPLVEKEGAARLIQLLNDIKDFSRYDQITGGKSISAAATSAMARQQAMTDLQYRVGSAAGGAIDTQQGFIVRLLQILGLSPDTLMQSQLKEAGHIQ